MTISANLEIPNVQYSAVGTFTTKDGIKQTQTASGRIPSAQRAPILRGVRWTTKPLHSRSEFDLVCSFIEHQRRGMNKFNGWDPTLTVPKAYCQSGLPANRGSDGGGGAFDGTATIKPAQFAATAIQIGALPAGFEIRVGDWFTLEEGGKVGLFKFAEAMTADGTGVLPSAVTFAQAAEPEVFTDAAVVRFSNIRAPFLISPDTDPPDWHGGGVQVSFTGINVLA